MKYLSGGSKKKLESNEILGINGGVMGGLTQIQKETLDNMKKLGEEPYKIAQKRVEFLRKNMIIDN